MKASDATLKKFAGEFRRVAAAPANTSGHTDTTTPIRYLTTATATKPATCLDSLEAMWKNGDWDPVAASNEYCVKKTAQALSQKLRLGEKKTKVRRADIVALVADRQITSEEQLYHEAKFLDAAYMTWLNNQSRLDFPGIQRSAHLTTESEAFLTRRKRTTKELVEEAAQLPCTGPQFASACPWKRFIQETFHINGVSPVAYYSDINRQLVGPRSFKTVYQLHFSELAHSRFSARSSSNSATMAL
jgi:hypothetical protein